MKGKITPLKDGPLKLESEEQIIEKDGEVVKATNPAMLCTCGQSGTKPFCDGSHVAAGFTSERGIEEEILQEYPGSQITVYFNRSICSGASRCVEGLPTVFKSGDGSHWIHPDEDTVENIIGRVKACPSGALAYRVGEEAVVDERREERITIEKDGPYHVEAVALERKHEPTRGSATKYSLCRCGHSKNKPFCDYSHAEIGWREDQTPAPERAAPAGPVSGSGDAPIVADNKPVLASLTKGETVAFCTCGQSSSQPMCDGSHAGTSFEPMVFNVEEDEDALLCACKSSASLPYCDGSHSQLPDRQVGKPGAR